MVQKTNSGPEIKAEIEKIEAMKKRAAKQAHKRELAPEEIPMARCTVTAHGDGKISMGQHVPGLGEVHFEEGEEFDCRLPSAIEHFKKGWVTFDGARQAVADAAEAARADDLRALAEKRALDKLIESAA